MGEPPSELLETRRQEAIAFFHVNQVARTAAERVVALIFSVAAIAGSVGTAAHTVDVVIPLPALIFLLLSYMFQQYADLTVIGITRRRLEDLVNYELKGKGLIYETVVADIRKVKPLVRSVRVLQVMLGLIAVGTAVMATKVAFDDQSALIEVSYAVGTTMAFISAIWSYIHMLRSEDVTDEKLEEADLGGDRMIWIPADLYHEARAAASSGELEAETFSRLIRRGLLK